MCLSANIPNLAKAISDAQQEAWIPGKVAAVDETILAWKGEGEWVKFIPNKPHPLGLEVHVLAVFSTKRESHTEVSLQLLEEKLNPPEAAAENCPLCKGPEEGGLCGKCKDLKAQIEEGKVKWEKADLEKMKKPELLRIAAKNYRAYFAVW